MSAKPRLLRLHNWQGRFIFRGGIMSIYHRDKCTKAEILVFRQKVKAFLDSHDIKYARLIALCAYNGEVRIHSGNIFSRKPRRVRREVISQNKHQTIIRRHYEPIIEKSYTSVYRADDWEGEKQALLTLGK